jgi:hypothetical protein
VVNEGTTFFVSLPTEQLDFMGNPIRRTGTVRQIPDEQA